MTLVGFMVIPSRLDGAGNIQAGVSVSDITPGECSPGNGGITGAQNSPAEGHLAQPSLIPFTATRETLRNGMSGQAVRARLILVNPSVRRKSH